MKLKYIALLAVVASAIIACRNDDDDGLITVPVRDRAEQAVADATLIQTYLQTHFYNYEEFQTPPADFDYKIKFDTISGANASKTPLINQVEEKLISRTDVEQNIYILKAREGSGERLKFADSSLTTYRGVELGADVPFDGSTAPVWFDLPTTIEGFYNALSESNTGTGSIQSPDGTTSFNNDFGVSAVFIPSGLGYFNSPPNGIGLYASLVFTFETYQRKATDHDGDLVPSLMEDINNNQFLFDANVDDDNGDNTDGDAVPNFRDPDDENDGVRTRLEIVTEMVDGKEVFVSFLDTDSDGTPDHLDTDDDGDGRSTRDEIKVNQTTGVITYTDTDGDGTPDYLDSDS